MAYKTIYTEVEVDVDLGEFDTDDLIEELENRGADLFTEYSTGGKEILEAIYHKRRLGFTDYEKELDELIYHALGKIV